MRRTSDQPAPSSSAIKSVGGATSLSGTVVSKRATERVTVLAVSRESRFERTTAQSPVLGTSKVKLPVAASRRSWYQEKASPRRKPWTSGAEATKASTWTPEYSS